MKKRKFKEFFKKWGFTIGFIIWIFLISFSFSTFYITNVSIWTKIIPISILIVYTIVACKMMVSSYDKEEIKKAEAKEKKLKELKKQYKFYIDLVNNQVQKTLNKFTNELQIVLVTDTSFEYVRSFENNKEWVCKNRIIGKSDSFIVASCLMYSLIDHPILIINDDVPELKELKFRINLEIAINCAFRIISEPTTYYEDNKGLWVEEKHPKVNMVPKGIIKNSELYERIRSTIYHDEMNDNRTSIMQFSNLLHLVYLNCH